MYNAIKQLFFGKSITSKQLNCLKECFTDEIGSKRRMECIQSLQDLVDLLERRDEISENNVQVFWEIADLLSDIEILDSLKNYQVPNDYELENEYALQRMQNDIQENLRIQSQNNPTLLGKPAASASFQTSPLEPFAFTGKRRDAVYNLISTEIGRKWREFGREIGMREGEMDNFEMDYPRDSKTKIRTMLEYWETEERRDRRKLAVVICEALENCRRKDLSRQVKELLTRQF